MILLLADLHNKTDFYKFMDAEQFLEEEDTLIVCGDFGLIWYGDERDNWLLDYVDSRKFTTLFVDGNHENFDAINKYPIIEKFGANCTNIRDRIFNLRRGEIYTIEGKRIFTLGGAECTDK